MGPPLMSELGLTTAPPRLPERIGPFAIHGVLGRGATGVVFDASDAQGQRIALKVIRPLGDTERVNLTVARFLREAQILQQVAHPGVVRLIGSGNHEGMLYLAMARVEGVSLLVVRRQGPLGFDALIQLGGQLADALFHLHQKGVVHRDIKPANILIDQHGRPVITDFGISGLADATGITRQGDLLGSPGFMAPEVVEGAIPDARSDQFALGRLLFELGALGEARKLPKNAPILEVLRVAMEIDWERFPNEVPFPGLHKIIRRLMATRPEDRFVGCDQVRDEILALGARELLDSDTLNEHVGKLALKPSTPWETLADDLDLGPAPTPLLELEPSPGPIQRFDTLRVPALSEEDVARPAPTPRLPGLIEVPGEPPIDELTEPPILLDRPTSNPRSAVLRSPSKPPSSSPRVPTSTPRALVLPGTTAAAHAAAAAAAAHATDTTLPMPPSSPRGTPPLVLPNAGSGDLTVAAGPSLALEAQVPRLERQVAKLKEDLATARRLANPPKKNGPWILGVVAALGLGTLAGVGVSRAIGPAAGLVLVGPRLDQEAPALIPTGRVPDARALADAQGMLERGREHQKERHLDEAERLYALCVELADLPDCHRGLGTLLSVYGDPQGRAHLLRYLELAPDASDAPAIRQALDNP
ncbi:MAG: serine/threonine protein kinase [Deltaproteobacteria bacterium]|nr:serine/threonine protein kinase [Deltaproteobacteria bacterium]